jgi:hypothetical protein
VGVGSGGGTVGGLRACTWPGQGLKNHGPVGGTSPQWGQTFVYMQM